MSKIDFSSTWPNALPTTMHMHDRELNPNLPGLEQSSKLTEGQGVRYSRPTILADNNSH